MNYHPTFIPTTTDTLTGRGKSVSAPAAQTVQQAELMHTLIPRQQDMRTVVVLRPTIVAPIGQGSTTLLYSLAANRDVGSNLARTDGWYKQYRD